MTSKSSNAYYKDNNKSLPKTISNKNKFSNERHTHLKEENFVRNNIHNNIIIIAYNFLFKFINILIRVIANLTNMLWKDLI